MGGAQSNNKGGKLSLLDALKMMVEDVEYYADQELLKKVKQINVNISFSLEKNRKKFIDLLKQSIPPQIDNNEDVLIENISSVFQCSLINNNPVMQNKNRIEKIDPDFLRDFRLMNFSSLKSVYENRYENQLRMLYNGLKSYCLFAQQIISQIKDQSLQWQIYVLIWEHFQNHLIKFSKDDDYDLEPLNKQFESKYHNLFPQQKILSIGAKLWGLHVQCPDINYILEQFKCLRRNKQSDNLPYHSIFNAILDMNIDARRVEWIGRSDFPLKGDLQYLVLNLQNDSNELLQEIRQNSQGELSILLSDWEKDNQLLKSYLPNWICEYFLDRNFFDFFEQQLIQELKMMKMEDLKNIQQKILQPEIQYDFGSQLKQISNNFSQINFFSFDNFMQNNSESILKILMKQFDTQFSSIILSSAMTQQGNSEALEQQPISDLLREEQFGGQESKPIEIENNQIFSQINQEQEIIVICRKYDQIKNRIKSNIESRDNKIKDRNRFKDPIVSSQAIEDLIDFKSEMNSVKVNEIIKYLGLQKQNDSLQIPQNNQIEIENIQSNIAAEILSMIK